MVILITEAGNNSPPAAASKSKARNANALLGLSFMARSPLASNRRVSSSTTDFREVIFWRLAAALSHATSESDFLSSQREFKRNWFVLQVARPSKHCHVNEGRVADALCASAGVDVTEDVNLWFYPLNGGE